ncbi:MAG: SPOR domain-containing protein [Gammaproteobacteria bacterium]|nr:SPOR domain-containing protein [Gammaproteobacteria bacterium]NNJ84508.1 hypothetical protein [Gammaproteobacteria bacterium]
MAHDYKYHAGKTPSSSSDKTPPPGWLWFIAGLTIGLFIAVLTYLSGQYSVRDSEQRAGVPPKAQSTQSADSQEKPRPPSELAESTESAELTEADQKKTKPKFEFYTILPEREIRVPEHELRSQEQAPKKAGASTSVATAGSYILQVGSFRYLGDADQLKAGLVLNGFDVEIQTVPTDSDDTWYRVRLGPYQDLGAVHRMRAKLQRSGFSPLVLKEKNRE